MISRFLMSLLLGLAAFMPNAMSEDLFTVRVADYVFDFPTSLVNGSPSSTKPDKISVQYDFNEIPYKRVGNLKAQLGEPLGDKKELFGYIGLSHPRAMMRITPEQTIAERMLVNISNDLPITGPGSTVYPRVEIAGTVTSQVPVAVHFKRDTGVILLDSFLLGDGDRWITKLSCRKMDDYRVPYPHCTVFHQTPGQGLVVQFSIHRDYRDMTAVFTEELTTMLREANLRAIRRLDGGCLYDKRDASNIEKAQLDKCKPLFATWQ